MKEDRDVHKRICEPLGKKEIARCLKLFDINAEEFQGWKDTNGDSYIHLPGKIPFQFGPVPHLLLDLYESKSKARNIWWTFNLPQGTLDISCYIVRLEDLPRMFKLLEKKQMEFLMVLLDLRNPCKKKRQTS